MEPVAEEPQLPPRASDEMCAPVVLMNLPLPVPNHKG